jgi:hypothetical protein
VSSSPGVSSSQGCHRVRGVTETGDVNESGIESSGKRKDGNGAGGNVYRMWDRVGEKGTRERRQGKEGRKG